MTKIKICGLYRNVDIDYVNEAKPDYAGFILNFPKSHRNLSIERCVVLRQKLSSEIKAVSVFVNQPLAELLQGVEDIKPDIIQLHGAEDDNYITVLREKTSLPIWKAFKVRDEADLEEAQKSCADEVILDNGYGTGTTFDWSILQGFERPFILAGGLTPDNISGAIEKLNPKIVDLSSGVETEQVKDRIKILAATRAIRR